MDPATPLRLVPESPRIGDEDAFSQSDLFQAKEVGERLGKIVGDLVGHSVLLIDGPWGSGKSVFVKQWAGLLRQRGHPVIYFDAFEHDHLTDAFFPLLAHLLRASNSETFPLHQHRSSLIDKAVSLTKAMPTVLLDLALRKGTAGMLTLPELREELSRTAASPLDNAAAMIEESIANADAQVSSVQQFRDALRDAVTSLRGSEGSRAPLVLVVDELDRCKPPYALNVLERIKHVFSVDDICFVLVTHLDGLADMVAREYGLTRTTRYLDKFYHLRFDIRSLLSDGSQDGHARYLDHLLGAFGLHPRYTGDHRDVLANLIRIHDISLRSQERIVLNVALLERALSTNPNWLAFHDGYFVAHLGIVLCVLRQEMPEVYYNASTGELVYQSINSFLRMDEWLGIPSLSRSNSALRWKLATADGKTVMTEEDQAALASSNMAIGDPYAAHRKLLVAICSLIDQFWQ